MLVHPHSRQPENSNKKAIFAVNRVGHQKDQTALGDCNRFGADVSLSIEMSLSFHGVNHDHGGIRCFAREIRSSSPVHGRRA